MRCVCNARRSNSFKMSESHAPYLNGHFFVLIDAFASRGHRFFHCHFYRSSSFRSPLPCWFQSQTHSIKKGKSIFSKSNLIFFYYPEVLLSCMTNPFYLAGSTSDIFWQFPKIKSTLKRSGHINSEDVRKNVREAWKRSPRGKVRKTFEFAHSLPGIGLLWRE